MHSFQKLAMAFLSCMISTAVQSQQVGAPAPDFAMETLDNKKLSLGDLKGKTVCLMTWASWCPHCKASMPYVSAFYEDAKKSGRPFEVVAIAIRDKPDAARATYVERQMPYLTALETPEFEKLYANSRKTPTFVIIGKDGVVKSVSSGRLYNRAELEKMVATGE